MSHRNVLGEECIPKEVAERIEMLKKSDEWRNKTPVNNLKWSKKLIVIEGSRASDPKKEEVEESLDSGHLHGS